MRVVEYGVTEEQTTCQTCHSVIAYTSYDKFEKTFNKGGDYGYDEKVIQMIKCPVCNKNIKLCEFGRNFVL